ncbi:hypothetical protein BGZ58_000938 [Dissophora ornata]|nr:hypothetical protein BGZ58_000938 [Dissophora ornata]
MALQEAKLMGLDLIPDPETNSNAPRDHRIRDNSRASYLYDNNDPEDWGSTASESESLDPSGTDQTRDEDSLETNGLTDREIDRLDGKTSSRLGRNNNSSSATTAAPATAAYPERDTGANTGPKGVIADQKYHQQQQLQERRSTHQAYNARMLAKAPMTTTYRQDRERERQEMEAQGLLEKDETEDLLAEDQDEKAILERIRGNRLKDMKWSANAGKAAGRGGSRKKLFGSLMEMNAAQYVNAIDTEEKDVTVIIHIYNEFNAGCKKLDGCLIRLAGRYATTKFIRIKAGEVDFDEEVCPTVLVYRAGDLIANLVMITYELGESYDDVELEELFTKHGVISPHDQYQRNDSFFEHALDSSMASMSTQFGDLDMSNLGLGIGDGGTTSSGLGRRGILSGNVKEFRYQDEDDEEEDDDDRDTR